MVGRITEAAKAFLAEHISSNAYDEEFVASFAKDHFSGYASVGASQHGGKWNLRWNTIHLNAPAKGTRIERNDLSLSCSAAGIRHLREVAISLDKKATRLLPG